MSAGQKKSRKRVSKLIFVGAACMSLWMSAAFVQASSSPSSFATSPTQIASK